MSQKKDYEKIFFSFMCKEGAKAAFAIPSTILGKGVYDFLKTRREHRFKINTIILSTGAGILVFLVRQFVEKYFNKKEVSSKEVHEIVSDLKSSGMTDKEINNYFKKLNKYKKY